MRQVKLNSSAVARVAKRTMAVTVVILVVSGYAILTSSERVMRGELHVVNDADLATLSSLYDSDGLAGLTGAVKTTTSAPLGVRAIQGLFTLDGKFIAGDLQTEPPVNQFEDIRLAPTPGAKETVYLSRRKLFPDAVLYVGRPTHIIVSTLKSLGMILPITAALLLLAMTLSGAYAAKILGRLIDRIDTTLAAFSGGDTSRRIPLGPDFDDRFHQISVGINGNLDLMQQATTTLENTTIAIAHDLRTPLTRASLALQAFQTDVDLTEDAASKLDLATEQLTKLSHTFDTILRISNINSQKAGSAFSTFDLNNLVQDIAESYAPVLEDAGFSLVANRSAPIQITADLHMLGQLIVNLLTNIMRHCPAGTTAQIEVLTVKDAPALRICDNGPGVPEDALKSIFQPFNRLDNSRTGEGTGLGLALVTAIAKHHSATILAKNLSPGLSVTVAFSTKPAGGKR